VRCGLLFLRSTLETGATFSFVQFVKDLSSYNVKIDAKVAAAKAVADAKAAADKAAADAKAAADKAAADAKAAADKAAADAKAAADKAAAAMAAKVAYNTGITYSQLARTPDKYKGKKVKFTGTVIQVMEGSGETQLRVAVNDNYDRILLVSYDSNITSTRVLEDDTVTLKGVNCVEKIAVGKCNFICIEKEITDAKQLLLRKTVGHLILRTFP
jgi:membrane protein involved in colicin uptake